MNILRLLRVSLVATSLLLTASQVYALPVFAAEQKERSAHAKKPSQFHYVCPMHDNVTSDKPGSCPKCRMKLVRKPVVKELPKDSN